MGALTKDIPKPLLRLGEKVLLEYILDALAACGIFDVIVVVGFQGDRIQEYLGTRYKKNTLTYIYNDAYRKTDNLYSLWLARKHAADGMVFLNGDTIFDSALLRKILDEPAGDAVLVDAYREEGHPIIVHEKDGRVHEIGHTIGKDGHGIAPGIYKLSSETAPLYFREAEKYFKDGPLRGGFVIPIQSLARDVLFRTVYASGEQWCNVNTVDDYKKAHTIINDFYN